MLCLLVSASVLIEVSFKHTVFVFVFVMHPVAVICQLRLKMRSLEYVSLIHISAIISCVLKVARPKVSMCEG